MQIAKWKGAEVTGVCRTEKVEFVRSLGVDHVLDYRTTDFTTQPERYDWIIASDSHHSIRSVRRALKPGGQYATLGGGSKDIIEAMVIGKLSSIGSSKWAGIMLWWKPFHEPDVRTLTELILEGTLKPAIDTRLPARPDPRGAGAGPQRRVAGQGADPGAARGGVAMAFTGFEPGAIQFLVDLAENNSREWFQPRKAEFERLIKRPMEELCVALEDEFRARDIPLHADPARSPFRIYRDTRFSKDKTPYKTAAAASFSWAGDGADATAGRSHTESVHASGGYFHLQPGEIFAGGGVWHPDKPWLDGVPAAIVDNRPSFARIVEAPAFVDTFGAVSDDGESLKRVPPGYPADHPAADLLRKKNVTFGRRLSDDEALSPSLPVLLAETFATGTPLMRYLASV